MDNLFDWINWLCLWIAILILAETVWTDFKYLLDNKSKSKTRGRVEYGLFYGFLATGNFIGMLGDVNVASVLQFVFILVLAFLSYLLLKTKQYL